MPFLPLHLKYNLYSQYAQQVWVAALRYLPTDSPGEEQGIQPCSHTGRTWGSSSSKTSNSHSARLIPAVLLLQKVLMDLYPREQLFVYPTPQSPGRKQSALGWQDMEDFRMSVLIACFNG